jgi:hypothetical protein
MDDAATPHGLGGWPGPARPWKTDRPGNWFVRHWRGELSLGVSYWAIGVLLGNIAQLVLLGLVRDDPADTSLSLRAMAALQLGALAAFALLQVWIDVGIWRSASRHTSRGGRAFLAVTAQVMVVLGVLSVFGLGAKSHVLDRWSELLTLALDRDPMPPVTIARGSDGHSLLLVGTLGSGSAQRVRQALAAAPGVRVLHLNSRGGRLYEGRAIAQEVRRRGLDTFVEAQCASACTFVYLAGHDRGATTEARIGFHSASIGGAEHSDPEGTQEMLSAYRAVGLSSAFLARVQATPSSQMWYPTRDELLDNGIVTRVSRGGESALLAMSGVHSAADYRKFLLTQPGWAALEARWPGTLAHVVAVGWAAHEGGASDDRVIAASREATLALVPRALAQASDDQLQAFHRLVADEIAAAAALGPEECGRFLDGKLEIMARFPTDLLARDQALTTALLAAPGAPSQLPSKAATESALRAALRQLPRDELDAIIAPEQHRDQPLLRCNAMRDLHGVLDTLPAARRIDALRRLYPES